MVALARRLMARPRLLLLDEPSLGLAPLIIQKVFAAIEEIRKRGATILLVEQNANMALSVADRGYVLETGQLALDGDARDLPPMKRSRQPTSEDTPGSSIAGFPVFDAAGIRRQAAQQERARRL
jgi:ABC-type branched-subunit amino acid transport system ATPase component